jgi:hypothetical protein
MPDRASFATMVTTRRSIDAADERPVSRIRDRDAVAGLVLPQTAGSAAEPPKWVSDEQCACATVRPTAIAKRSADSAVEQRGGPLVKELVGYLLDNLYLDFQGDISVDKVRGFLREDDSREARQLLSKIIEEKGVDDLLLTLADCLREYIRTGVTESVVREQLSTYAES